MYGLSGRKSFVPLVSTDTQFKTISPRTGFSRLTAALCILEEAKGFVAAISHPPSLYVGGIPDIPLPVIRCNAYLHFDCSFLDTGF